MSGTAALHCALCGGPVRPPFRAPRPPEIAPDLDMRPGEPLRSTLRDWVQACGRCGAAAWDLTTLPQHAESVVRSDAYRRLNLDTAEDTLLFRRWAMICEAIGDRPMAAEAMLQAAWAADDGADMVIAALARREVVRLWGEPADRLTALRMLDVLRRAGEFAAVETRGTLLAASGPDRFAAAIIGFQRERAAGRDVGRHLLSSAAPGHVVPADLPRPKFWDAFWLD